jgi:hypothetical protein
MDQLNFRTRRSSRRHELKLRRIKSLGQVEQRLNAFGSLGVTIAGEMLQIFAIDDNGAFTHTRQANIRAAPLQSD